MALALQGTVATHQRLLLGRMLRQLSELERQIADLTAEIEQRMAPHEGLIARLSTIPGLIAFPRGPSRRDWNRHGRLW